MAEAFYSNELGRVTICDPIIVQTVMPELSVENKFRPAAKVKMNPRIMKTEEGKVNIDAQVACAYGINIQEEAQKLQKRIKHAVETITGLTVGEVAVKVEQVFFPEKSQATVPGQEE